MMMMMMMLMMMMLMMMMMMIMMMMIMMMMMMMTMTMTMTMAMTMMMMMMMTMMTMMMMMMTRMTMMMMMIMMMRRRMMRMMTMMTMTTVTMTMTMTMMMMMMMMITIMIMIMISWSWRLSVRSNVRVGANMFKHVETILYSSIHGFIIDPSTSSSWLDLVESRVGICTIGTRMGTWTNSNSWHLRILKNDESGFGKDEYLCGMVWFISVYHALSDLKKKLLHFIMINAPFKTARHA